MEKENAQKQTSNINAKSFITALIIIAILMVFAYILTFLVDAGEYNRVLDENGNLIAVSGTYKVLETGGIPFWKWILSPFLVLGSDNSTTIIAIIIFLLVIGGIFTCLEKCGFMKYMLNKMANKFSKSRYKLLTFIMLFFMAMGSLIGSFEECVPLIPITVALCISLGFDALTGLSISILSAGCGFAAGVFNPFTVGIAQTLSGLPMYSGFWLRLVAFVLIYILLATFVLLHAKKIAKPVIELSIVFVKDKNLDKAILCFAIIMAFGIALVFSSAFITFLRDYTMIIVAIVFLVAGVTACIVSKVKAKTFFKNFLDGIINFFPAVLMILMASSIKYTLEEAKILDTILYFFETTMKNLPSWSVILFAYLIVLIMNFFIPSGSAKVFLLIPILKAIADIFALSPQLFILAFIFGDGFSNVFYPTNPVLLLSLGLSNVSYTKWVKYSGVFQLVNIVLTCGILIFGFFIGY